VVCKWVDRARRQAGTWDALACELGVSYQYFQTFEARDAGMSLAIAIDLADYLEITLDELVGRR
jgi:ribosome-binding protein aMBF1 (putative translation factor)